MTIVHLLAALPAVQGTSQFAERCFSALGSGEISERESSNHSEGIYFVSCLGDLTITIARSDETAHPDLPYWIAVSSHNQSDKELIETVDLLVRRLLLSNGFRVLRFANFAKADEVVVDYA